jgi:hypothetical protein
MRSLLTLSYLLISTLTTGQELLVIAAIIVIVGLALTASTRQW